MDVYFILVEPAVPGNIGATARAIKTMGFSKLRLIRPTDHLSSEARMLAHASQEILENAGVFNSLAGSLEDIDFSIATTAKYKDARAEYHPVHSIPGIIRSKRDTIQNYAIVFGREESGLSNQEIRACDIASSIRMKQSYPSLNLSQAVMIYAYTLAGLTEDELQSGGQSTDRREFKTMMDKSKLLLNKLEMDRSPALYNRILERLALLGEEDVRLLLSILGRLE
jgi:tRNA/rRNA methyltransferase